LPLLEIQSLSRFFGGIKAVSEFTLSVSAGSVHGLIGPNGSGKTTVFNCLTGIYPPTAGRVLFNKERIDHLPPHQIVARGMARTFQNLRLFAAMTALENVMVARHLHLRSGVLDAIVGTPSARNDQRETMALAADILSFCGLAGREDAIASSLPYGLQRRLEIARALATEPKLLLLDEPAAGMNHAEAAALKELVLAIRDRGVTVFIIEHNVRLVMGLCERVSVMDVGQLIADGTPDHIVKNPAVIEAYLGTEL
jgi:branched-chain amino acid transport system ATP-binding protein